MLTFFRKIRKSFLEAGSTRKYLFYAIGEIALVVIGILIALQINNWNQNRLDRREERKILISISKDLFRMHDYCQICGRTQQDVLNASNRLLRVIHSKNNVIDEIEVEQDLSVLFKRCFVGEGLTENIYDVLMGSDQLELVSSRALRDELATLDSWIGTLRPYDILQAEFVDSQLKPFLNGYIDRTRLSYNSPSWRSRIDTSLFEKRFTVSYEGLLKNQEFANLLVDMTIHCNSIVGMYQFIDNSIRSIDSILILEMPDLNPEILSRSNE